MADLEQYPDIMTVEDLMDFLSIGKNSAYGLLQSGAISTLRIGRIYRIPKVAVYEYIGKREV